MKYEVTRKMYVRADRPSRSAKVLARLEPGYIVEIEKTVEGESWKGVDKWYVDQFGQFYWSGSLANPEGEKEIPTIFDVDYTSYSMVSKAIETFDIGKLWSLTTGKGVRVALIDSGIDEQHPQLMNKVVDRAKHRKMPTIKDEHGHGTQMAGIIGGNNKSNVLIGLAPACDIITYKVLDKSPKLDNIEYLIDGIDFAIKKNAELISISIADPSESERLENKITEALEHNIPVIASTGNESIVEYPARFGGVISVGAIDIRSEQWELWSKNPRDANHVDYLAPGTEVLSSDLGGKYKKVIGTSPAASFMTGLIALVLSYYKNTKNIGLSIDELKVVLEHSSERGNLEEGSRYGYIKINKLIKTLTS